MREPPATAGEPCKTCGHKPLPMKPFSWLRVHLKYWWSSNPDNHHDWVMSNLLKQYPDGVELVPDMPKEEKKDNLDDLIYQWCWYAFEQRTIHDKFSNDLRDCLNDIVAARCLAGIYDGKVSFPRWLEQFKLNDKRKIIGVKECL